MRATAGLPFLLEEGDEVAFVPPQTDVPRTAVVSSVAPIDDYSAEVLFEGVGAQEAAVLVGSHCLILRDSIDPEVFEQVSAMWEGWTVIDEKIGMIGEVVGIVDNPGQSLIEVRREDGATVLIPAVDDIILDVNTADAIIGVSLPTGLLEL